jgi:molecular chaperone HscB
MTDYFDVFGLERKLQVDLGALQRRFYALSRQHHPDFHQMAGEDEQASALERSALVNRAYRALRDPLARLAYLISLEDGTSPSEDGTVPPKAPMDLLEEMLEIQETLEEAKASGLNAETTERLTRERQRLMERQAANDVDMVGRFAEWDRARDAGGDTKPLLAWFKQALAGRAYLRTVIEDLSGALGEDQESDVSHRRH